MMALAESGSDLDAIYLESVRQRLAGHRDAAYELLTVCLELNPNAPEALYDMARLKLSASVLLDSASVAQGDSLLRRAYAVDTTNADIRTYLARHLLSRGDYAEATRLYERMCAVKKPNYNDLGTLLQLYEIQAQYPQALATVDRMEVLEGPDAQTSWERFQIHQCMGHAELAVHIYDSLLVKAMPDPATPDYVREQLMRQPMYYQKVVALREQLVDAIVARDAEKTVALCREGQLYEPEYLPYYYYEGLTHFMQNDSLRALDACQRGLNTLSGETDATMASELYSLAGDLYTHLGNIEAAVEAYEEAYRRDSSSVAFLNNYAYQLALLGRDLDKAEAMSRRAVESEPTNATYLDTLAWVLHRQGQQREARKYIDEAFRYAEEIDEEMRQHRAAIYQSK